MAGKKNKGLVSINKKRMYNGEEVQPVLYSSYSGKRKMVGSIKGILIVDKDGKPIPFKSIGV